MTITHEHDGSREQLLFDYRRAQQKRKKQPAIVRIPEQEPLVLNNGWIEQAVKLRSKHRNERPPATEIELVVIHCSSLPYGHFGGDALEDFFRGCLDVTVHPSFVNIAKYRLAPHFLIRRDGRLVNFVSTKRRAWHAGVSSFRGKKRCNDFSIGIDLEGTETTLYTEEQYSQLLALLLCLQEHYPLLADPDRIVAHSDVDEWHTDPGPAFDWVRLREAYRQHTQSGESSSAPPVREAYRQHTQSGESSSAPPAGRCKLCCNIL